MSKNKLSLLIPIIPIFLFVLFFSVNSSLAQTSGSSGANDAIAVRIIPNPNHYSVSRWYESQGFKGAPQALRVDGYEAIRDGRTVYVNAANITTTTPLAIYTNIYLISYNQEPSTKTVDILGQIVKNWKFNNNLIESTNPVPTCSISALPCKSNTDCAKDQECSATTNSCQLKVAKNCSIDSECPQNIFCSSLKAKIIRDIKRIGQSEELKEALYKYKLANGSYPKLLSGSYLSGHTVSVWPSWSEALLSNLSLSQSFVDPINRLGNCGDTKYDPVTCWDKQNKEFYNSQTGNSNLILPERSYGFVYNTDENGSNYNLCTVMETRGLYVFKPDATSPVSDNCVDGSGTISGGHAANTAPRIIDFYLKGEADKPLNAYVKAVDEQNNPMTWTLSTPGSWPNWSAAPVLKNTNNPNQKKIYASQAGGPGNYPITLEISDNQIPSMYISTSTYLTIVNPKPFIEADNGEFSLDPTELFTYSFYFSDDNLANPDSAYTVTKRSGDNNFDMLDFPPPTFSPAGPNRYKVTYQGYIATTSQFIRDYDYIYRATVRDKYNAITTKDFKITLKAENPTLNFNCPPNQRVGQTYSCFIGYVQQKNHQIAYSSNNTPPAFALRRASTTNYYQNNNYQAAKLTSPIDFVPNIFRKIFSLFRPTKAIATNSTETTFMPPGTLESVYLAGVSLAPLNSNITLKATNEYGASSTKTFNLRINTYCGDDIKQKPNSEGRGGVYNDGYEDCDITAGVSLDNGIIVVSSSADTQYGCSTEVAPTPFPIPSGGFCTFKSPVDGGGFCGDGYCQNLIGTSSMEVETPDNCSADCDPSCTPSCGGNVCGGNGCGGSCGTCPSGNICQNGNCEQTCQPQCAGKVCGDDGCGGKCGSDCPTGQHCTSGQCVPDCTPDCTPNTCWPNGACTVYVHQCGGDGCGGSCGTCDNPLLPECILGKCMPAQNVIPCGNGSCDGATQVCCGNVCRNKTEFKSCAPCGHANFCCPINTFCREDQKACNHVSANNGCGVAPLPY